ncbi:MAG: hypothetical protein KJ799_07025 [Bacteroidetes bacterium]|nr:hypothetical protein [Bacteroidota bacterium]MBU1679915.1 hypothetical protein [Bacteroidota bacterium]MBU2506459.1 hypothetical protein [Bacteroidota bacterium]
MSSKVPKAPKKSDVIKIPKSHESPAQYKNFPISWQISSVDDNSRWGLTSLRNKFTFQENNIVNDLESLHDDLGCALIEFDKKGFNSVDDMLQKLFRKSNGNISSEQQRVILKSLDENVFWSQIFPKLKHFEERTWGSIEREQYGAKGKSKHHSVEVSKIIKEAQKRLSDLQLDEFDELFSLRITGKIRIWGIRQCSYLRVLWIDLEHEICPTIKD